MTEREIILIPQGFHEAQIIDLEPYGELKSSPAKFAVKVKLQVGQHLPVFAFVVGHLPAVQMILAAKSFYLGLRVRVEIKHTQHAEQTFMDARIKWDL